MMSSLAVLMLGNVSYFPDRLKAPRCAQIWTTESAEVSRDSLAADGWVFRVWDSGFAEALALGKKGRLKAVLQTRRSDFRWPSYSMQLKQDFRLTSRMVTGRSTEFDTTPIAKMNCRGGSGTYVFNET
jgi:hypothetical protein